MQDGDGTGTITGVDERVARLAVVFLIAFVAGTACGIWWHKGLGVSGPVVAAPPTPPPTDARTVADAVRIAELEAEVRRLEDRLAAQADEAASDVLAWPEGRPPEFTPDGFPDRFEGVLAACRPAVELVGIDCTEPPCIAKLRVANGWHDQLIGRCAPWQDTYGATASLATFGVDCEAREPERIALLSPIDRTWVDAFDEAAAQTYDLRLDKRWEAIRAGWICRGEG